MAIVDFSPGAGSHRKKPISAKKRKKILELYAKIPGIKKKSDKQLEADTLHAEQLLDTQL